MYVNNKESFNPHAYPNFIKNELIELKEIATQLMPIDIEKYYKHYYFLIFVYSSIVLLGLIAMVLNYIYLTPLLVAN